MLEIFASTKYSLKFVFKIAQIFASQNVIDFCKFYLKNMRFLCSLILLPKSSNKKNNKIFVNIKLRSLMNYLSMFMPDSQSEPLTLATPKNLWQHAIQRHHH